MRVIIPANTFMATWLAVSYCVTKPHGFGLCRICGSQHSGISILRLGKARSPSICIKHDADCFH